MPSLNSAVLVTEWGCAWIRRHQILACSCWRPGSPYRPRMRMSHESLYPDPKWRYSAHTCCLSCRLPAHSRRAVPPALPAWCTLPGEEPVAAVAWNRGGGHRCWWWWQGKATLLYICQSVTLLLFPVIKKKLAENSLSFLRYCSVDTQTLLQRCLNTNA